MRLTLAALTGLVLAVPAGAQQDAPPTVVAEAPQGPLRTVEVDRVVGIVGTHPVLFSEVLEQLNFERANGLQVPADSAGQLALARSILSRIVDVEVLLLVADEYNIEVTDADVTTAVEQRVDDVRGRFPTEEAFRAALVREGFGTPEQYRQQAVVEAKRAELQQRARDSLRANGRLAPVNVTEAEVREAFEGFKASAPEQPASVAFRQIVVAPRPRLESLIAARARIDTLRMKLEAGADFDSMARAVSQDQATASRGGDLGWNRRGNMVAEFDRMMFALNVGRISPIVQTIYGFHVMRVDRVRAGEVRARHILIRPAIDSADVAEAHALADSVLALWKAGTPYDTLVQRFHDQEETRTLPEGTPIDSLPAEYRVALRGVEPQAFTGVFALPDPVSGYNKWAVARVLSVRPAGVVRLEDWQQRIRDQLREEKSLRRTLDNLRQKYYVSLRL